MLGQSGFSFVVFLLICGLVRGFDLIDSNDDDLQEPNQLFSDGYIQDFRDHQQVVRDHVLNNTNPNLDNAFLFARAGRDIDFNTSIFPFLEEM